MKRRDFNRIAGLGVLGIQSFPVVAPIKVLQNDYEQKPKVPLGLCNHSLRRMRLNAGPLIQYAAKQKLDSVLFNTFQPFESLEAGYLSKLYEMAKANDISIYVGAGSISEKSLAFSNKYGNANTLLKEGIRVAKALDSPVVCCRIGNIEDRYSEGGIRMHMNEVVKVMKAVRGPALDAGIKFAFENHAGDLRTEELLEIIHETGTDICGALYDPGNAIWAMEDPMIALSLLGSLIVCTSVRDVMVWESEGGATFQWTAIGQGLMDYKLFANRMAEFCPGVPIHVETISNDPRLLPFLKPDFWKGFPDLAASGIVGFLKLLRIGNPMELSEPPAGTDSSSFEIESQKLELLISLQYLRNNCGVGQKL